MARYEKKKREKQQKQNMLADYNKAITKSIDRYLSPFLHTNLSGRHGSSNTPLTMSANVSNLSLKSSLNQRVLLRFLDSAS